MERTQKSTGSMGVHDKFSKKETALKAKKPKKGKNMMAHGDEKSRSLNILSGMKRRNEVR